MEDEQIAMDAAPGVDAPPGAAAATLVRWTQGPGCVTVETPCLHADGEPVCVQIKPGAAGVMVSDAGAAAERLSRLDGGFMRGDPESASATLEAAALRYGVDLDLAGAFCLRVGPGDDAALSSAIRAVANAAVYAETVGSLTDKLMAGMERRLAARTAAVAGSAPGPDGAGLLAAVKALADPHHECHQGLQGPWQDYAQTALFGRVIAAEEWWPEGQPINADEMLARIRAPAAAEPQAGPADAE